MVEIPGTNLVLQHGTGQLVAVEINGAASVNEHDFAGIRDLADAVGDDLTCGIVLHTGRTAVPFGDRFWALPVETPWRG